MEYQTTCQKRRSARDARICKKYAEATGSKMAIATALAFEEKLSVDSIRRILKKNFLIGRNDGAVCGG